MKLIADSGSTKTDWCSIEENKPTLHFTTQGINPYMLSKGEITNIFQKEVVAVLEGRKTNEVFFYGAGCTEEQAPIIATSITEGLHCEKVEVHSDLLGAARSLCHKSAGIACILGTGSNSCLYDGEKIIENVSPLGFILGDEGSGAVLGRNLVGDLLKGQLSTKLVHLFFEETGLTRAEILNKVYKQNFPNRFLASLTHFIATHKHEEKLHTFLLYHFSRFFTRNISLYNKPELPINFIGSIAYYFSDELKEAAKHEGYRIGHIQKSPMEGLKTYHA